jgi:predicted nucleic acid-binding protein
LIILDTNVISEVLRPKPDDSVLAWLNQQEPETLYLTAVVLSELLFGIELLPESKRRKKLAEHFDQWLLKEFANRILPFDHSAAVIYAKQRALARIAGRDVRISDGQIAAIAVLHGFSVATRDVAPFAAMGAKVIDPWIGG